MKSYYNIRDSYVIYKHSSQEPIELKKFVLIVNSFMKFLSKKLLQSGSVAIPERLGNVNVIGKKVKARIEDGYIRGLAPDWAKTKELWEQDEEAKDNKQLVFHFNEQTNGIRYRFFWSKNRVLVSNKTLYNLKLTRTNKRELSQLVQNGKEYLLK